MSWIIIVCKRNFQKKSYLDEKHIGTKRFVMLLKLGVKGEENLVVLGEGSFLESLLLNLAHFTISTTALPFEAPWPP